jgi:DNA-binding transcriptional MerR regulator
MIKNRRFTAFSLSFLDIMACGFGAVTLLFLILRHNVVVEVQPDSKLAAEVEMLKEDVQDAEEERVDLLNSIEDLELQLVTVRGLSKRYLTELEEVEESIQSDPEERIAMLRRQVQELERETANLEEVEYGDKVRQFLGEGNRQYLTGLTLGGERVMVLVDGSASMLADTVVNAVRRRNMEPEKRVESPKWQWTLRTVEWLLAQLPPSSRFQVYIFNTEALPAVAGSEGEWLDAADSLQLEEAVDGLKAYAPEGGTSLENAIVALNDFAEKPDNLFLLTDGLPTQGKSPPGSAMVSGEQRRRNFLTAVGQLPAGVPVNTILFPMEGDPEAAALFWQFAMSTRGAFIAPSRDGP